MAKRFRRKLRRYSPRRRYRAFRRHKQPLSLLVAAPTLYHAVAAPLLGDNVRMGAKKMYESTNSLSDAALEFANVLSLNFTGFSMKGPDAGKFYGAFPIATYGSIIGGYIGHLIANRMGVNRTFKKLPIIGKWVNI